MKNNIFIILILLSSLTGFSLTLYFIYPEDIDLSNPLYGSYMLLSSSIFYFVLNYIMNNKDSIVLTTKQQWLFVIFNAIFGFFGFALALICLYALPIDNHIESLASSLFLLSSIIFLSSNFFIKKD